MATSTRALGSRYRLEELIGVGAMGSVYRTVEVATGDLVAAKVLKPELTRDPEVVARFVQERSILVGLAHPNIVRVRDLVVEGDDLAIVMELVRGEDLRSHLRKRGTLAPADAVRVTVAVLEALASAHQQNCLHRDIKPDNVLVEGDDPTRADAVKLSDFSISRLSDASSIKATGLLGTPEYMPPELFSHGTFSAASDVYAVGVMLYELLAGRTPFAGAGNGYTIGQRHVEMLPPALTVPAALWGVVARLLDKDPSLRLTASGAAAALTELEAGLAGVSALPPQPEPTGWARAGAVAGSTTDAGHVPAIQDVGATQIKVDSPDLAPLPVTAGDAIALAPVADLAPGETNVVARPTGKHAAPQIQSQAPVGVKEPAKLDLKSPLVISGIVAAVIALVVLVVVLKPGGGGAGGTAAAVPDASVSKPSAPSTAGLIINRTASYTAKAGEARMSFLLTPADLTLSGPFLLAVPDVEGSSCPDVDWGSARASRFKDAPGCVYSVSSGALPSDGLTVTAKISADLDGNIDDALGVWLARSDSELTSALGQVNASSTDFAAQRITGFTIDPGTTTPTIGKPVDLKVKAVWVGGEGPVIYTTGASDPTVERLFGQLPEFGSTCSAIDVEEGKIQPKFSTGGEDCKVTAALGAIKGTSSPLRINY